MKALTKKQLQARVKRLERKNRKLERSLGTMYAVSMESIRIAKALATMVPPPNYNYAEGM